MSGPRDGLEAESGSALLRAVAWAQHWITDIYRLDLDLQAERFVVSPEAAREMLPTGSPRSGVVVVEEPTVVSLGLYVAPEDQGDPLAVIEETSHLIYLAWLASRDLSASRLMLELQGEVDRYAVMRIRGRDALQHFEEFEWCDWMDRQTHDMYVTAHRCAYRYCRKLEHHYPRRADTPALLRELRQFYRATPEQKRRAAA